MRADPAWITVTAGVPDCSKRNTNVRRRRKKIVKCDTQLRDDLPFRRSDPFLASPPVHTER